MLTNVKSKQIAYEINSIDDELLTELFSIKTNDAVSIMFDGCELCLITPPYIRMNHKKKNELPQINPSHIVQLCQPSFMPIFTKTNEPFQLFSQLQGESIVIKLTFRKAAKNQMLNLLEQYEAYLDGVEQPSYNKLIRKGQLKLKNTLRQFADIAECERNEEFENKIISTCYMFHFELQCSNINKIQRILDELSYYNQLIVIPYLSQSIFSVQLLSEQELKTLLINEAIHSINETEIEQIETDTHTETLESPIHLLPIKEKESEPFNENVVDEIKLALKQSKVIKDHKIELVDKESGATIQRVTFKIPKGLTFSEIKNRHEDIKAAMATEISIIQGNTPNTISFLIPKQKRDIIYLKELLTDNEFKAFIKEANLPFVCGIDMYNQPIFKCLTTAPHLLIAGATNSGKSVFINSLLTTLILTKKSKDLKIYLIDPKQNEFVNYKDIPHVEKIVTNTSEVIPLLEKLIKEMEERYEKMAKERAKNIVNYNKKSKQKFSYIVCAIDEYNDLKIQYPEIETYIERLCQKARAAGIHLIIATQRPDKEVMSGVIKTNLPSRISFKLNNSSEYRTVFGTGIPYELIGFGDGVVKYIAQTEEFIRFQAPVISLNEEDEELFFDGLKKYFKGENIIGENIIEEPTINKLKRIIAKTGETRVKELQQQMGIRINDVSNLIKQLVNEKWLKKDGKGYKIIASEEELNKWRGELM